jgi:hypothetical protein
VNSGHGNCYGDTVTQGIRNNAVELEDLEIQVQKGKQLVHQSELKVEAIEATIHEIEKFHPKIKIIRRQAPPETTSEDSFSFFAGKLLGKAA